MINLCLKLAAALVYQHQSARKVHVVDWIDGDFPLDFEHAGQGGYLLGCPWPRNRKTDCYDPLLQGSIGRSDRGLDRDSRMCTGRYLD